MFLLITQHLRPLVFLTTATTTAPTAQPEEYPYTIRSVALTAETGEALSEIPEYGGFIIDADIIKNTERSERDHIFAAVYSSSGKLLSLDYKQVKVGDETSVDLHVPKQTEKIAQIRIFVWHDFNDIKPLSEVFTNIK